MLGGLPFYCHDGKDWKVKKTASERLEEIKNQEWAICGGWQKEMIKLNQVGYFDTDKADKRITASLALVSLDTFIKIQNPDTVELTVKKADALTLLGTYLQILSRYAKSAGLNYDNFLEQYKLPSSDSPIKPQDK